MRLALAAIVAVSLAACNAAGVTLSPAHGEHDTAVANASYSMVYAFHGEPDGYVPNHGLVSDGSGVLYGVTYYGGATPHRCNGTVGCGTFFAFDPVSLQETVLYSFGQTQHDGQLPDSLLLYKGTFYGTTSDGGTSASFGTVFEITRPGPDSSTWVERVLHRFRGPPQDGSDPVALTVDRTGTLYATAASGGSGTACLLGCGAIFELAPPKTANGEWRETLVHSFTGVPDGTAPSNLVRAPDGSFYGETNAGGRSRACGTQRGCGTIFALKRHGLQWRETVVHSFHAMHAPKNDGEFPYGGLTLADDGTLYGVTAYGGPPKRCSAQGYPWSGCGTFFLFEPPSGRRTQWTESLLYSFGGNPSDGSAPVGLTRYGADFYGTTAKGGGAYCNNYEGCGTLFHMIPPPRGTRWTEAVAHSFVGGATDGWDPSGSVVAGRKALYGVTMYGGPYCPFGCGTIYKLQPK